MFRTSESNVLTIALAKRTFLNVDSSFFDEYTQLFSNRLS